MYVLPLTLHFLIVIQMIHLCRYSVYGADFDNMRSLLSAVDWVSVNDCWDCSSETYDRIMGACVPLTRLKKCMTKEAVRLKNKENQLWIHYTETKSYDLLLDS